MGEWLADVELICSNCRAYNHASSGIVASARKFEGAVAGLRQGPLFAAAAAAAGGGGGGGGAAMES